jgi:predicted NAD-dependent protein-ADP-ribosyltransferase YbiA (DUF1768 family)
MLFSDPIIKDKIRVEKSPMAAKMKAKSHSANQIILQMSPQDIANMETCVLLKFQQHPELARLLLVTGNSPIYEDASGRN